MPDFEKRATDAYLQAHRAFSAILLRHVPMLIGEGVPDDEYDQEATRLLTKFKGAASVEDADAIVVDFFVDPNIANSQRQSWRALATELWESWSTFREALTQARSD